MFHVKQKPPVAVIGGGHAGCEAALSLARMGVPVYLLTLDPSRIAEMSCNPSIGGVGKGQLVKEIDALGGEMGRNADFTGIQFKRLNTRKGSAVQSSRCQSDKKKYALRMQSQIHSEPLLTVVTGEVKAITSRGGRIAAVEVVLKSGGAEQFEVSSVIITSGTFMKAVMHCGDMTSEGGRFGEGSSNGLSDSLRDFGFPILRLKTGTPPRLLRESIDFAMMECQAGDVPPRRFSFWDTQIVLPQVNCYLTYSNEHTHDVIRQNLSRSPLYSGQIQGVGPRYCPSIEDKVVKFPDKDRHPLFFEPEALDSNWIYPNGISTSLPADVQEAFVRSIPGCSEVQFARHGYAVEYDCIDARSLQKTLESRDVPGLYLAGQVNGTSGYEEAAIQGLVAGISAGLAWKDEPPLILSRTEAYVGVLIDDLTSRGVTEPYRMFTSRAEYRLSLREDNADLRLSPIGRRIGLLRDKEFARFETRRETLEKAKKQLETTTFHPSDTANARLVALGTSPMEQAQSYAQLLKRPEIGLRDLIALSVEGFVLDLEESSEETLEVETKYAGYIAMQRQEIAKLDKMRETRIPDGFDYASVPGLSNELREKLTRHRPLSLSEAAAISGVTPAALTTLLFRLRKPVP